MRQREAERRTPTFEGKEYGKANLLRLEFWGLNNKRTINAVAIKIGVFRLTCWREKKQIPCLKMHQSSIQIIKKRRPHFDGQSEVLIDES